LPADGVGLALSAEPAIFRDMSDGKMPWPIVNDALLTALVVQVVLAVSGHFIGFIGRHWGGASVAVSAVLGFIFGVWANPTPTLTSGAGGVLVAGGGILAGAVVMFVLPDAKMATLLNFVLIGVVAGAIGGAIGSMVGRSVFGS
jgi:hypothetical protein